MQRVVFHFSKLGNLKYISHLDFQRLWQRLFRIAGIAVCNTQGFNPKPRIRFALPLATGFESEGELLEVFLVGGNNTDLVKTLNEVNLPGLKILAATPVPESFPKLTSLVDALEYRVNLPDNGDIVLGNIVDQVETKGGMLNLSEYLLVSQVQGQDWRLLIKSKMQKTLRPDLVAKHYFTEYDEVQFKITRTGIFTRQTLQILPQGLSILFD